MSSRTTLVVAAVLLQAPVAAWALQYGFDVGYSARYTDNATRVPLDPVSDIESNLIGYGEVLIQTPRLDLTANGSVELESYARDSYEPQSIETFNGNALYTFLPDRFTWALDDTLQNTRTNALLPVTPDNIEQTNGFSTGPDMNFRFSSRNTVGFQARYENDWYEESKALSNDRGIGEINWQYRLSEPVAFVTRYRYESVRYRDDVPGADYVFDSWTAGLQGQVGTTITYRFEMGPGRVRQELQETLTDTVGYAEFARQIRSDTGLRIGASYSVTDSGRTAQLDPAVDSNLQVGGVNTGQPDFAYVREVRAEYFSAFGHLKYSVAGTVRDENFKISQQDVLESGGGGVMEYEFTPRLVGLASGSFTRSDYPLLQRVDDDILVSVGLRFRFQRNWDATLSALHDQRESTDPSQEYVENSLLAAVRYHFQSRRVTGN